MKKAVLIFLTALFACMLVIGHAHASENGVRICIDAKPLYAPKEAYIENGRTMVPARSIFERLGAVVEWNGDTGSVIATKDERWVKLIIGSRALNVNGRLSTMDTAPVIIDGTTFVPARAVSQAFDANVTWIEELRTVNITTGNTKTLGKYPTVLLPDLSGATVVTSEKDNQAIYSITTEESEDSSVAPYIIGLVKSYEDAMTNIGWSKSITENSAALFETEFYNDPLDICPCKVRFYVKKDGVGKYTVGINVNDNIIVYNILTGETESVTESDYLLTAKYGDASVWKKSVGKTVTLYGVNNDTVVVYDYDVYGYLISGYTEKPKKVVMYSPEGECENIPVHLVTQYRNLGYTLNAFVLMYSPNGEVQNIPDELFLQKIAEGWSTEPFRITLYHHNGDIIIVDRHEKDRYLAEGWYEKLLVPMYRADGTKKYVAQSDVDTHIVLGWSTQMPQQEAVTEPENGDIITENTTVYITPNGKKYHISQKCAGSGAIPKAYREVQGTYGPCKTCANK